MSFTITDNTSTILADKKQKASIFLRNVAEQIAIESQEKTPRKTGALRRDILKEVMGLKGRVVWLKDYASIQETKQFKKYTTPGTGPNFARTTVEKIAKDTNAIAIKTGLI